MYPFSYLDRTLPVSGAPVSPSIHEVFTVTLFQLRLIS